MYLVFGACTFGICIKQCHYLADFNTVTHHSDQAHGQCRSMRTRSQGSLTYLVLPHIGTEQYSHLISLFLSVMQQTPLESSDGFLQQLCGGIVRCCGWSSLSIHTRQGFPLFETFIYPEQVRPGGSPSWQQVLRFCSCRSSRSWSLELVLLCNLAPFFLGLFTVLFKDDFLEGASLNSGILVRYPRIPGKTVGQTYLCRNFLMSMDQKFYL